MSAYDACYIAAAARAGFPLITADARLARQAAAGDYDVRWREAVFNITFPRAHRALWSASSIMDPDRPLGSPSPRDRHEGTAPHASRVLQQGLQQRVWG